MSVPAITGVTTGVTAFAGVVAEGPFDTAMPVASAAAFGATFGSTVTPLSLAVSQFFENGGTAAIIVGVPASAGADDSVSAPENQAAARGLWSLESAPRFDLLCVPAYGFETYAENRCAYETGGTGTVPPAPRALSGRPDAGLDQCRRGVVGPRAHRLGRLGPGPGESRGRLPAAAHRLGSCRRTGAQLRTVRRRCRRRGADRSRAWCLASARRTLRRTTRRGRARARPGSRRRGAAERGRDQPAARVSGEGRSRLGGAHTRGRRRVGIRVEVCTGPAAVPLHRGIDRGRHALGGLRAQRPGDVGGVSGAW